MNGYYEDYELSFDCIVLACSTVGDKYLILDVDTKETGWCSCHLVDIG